MDNSYIDFLLENQRKYFQTGATLDVAFRIEMLKKLKKEIKAHESEINDALQADLGKSAFESYMCETGMALSEISYMLRHIRHFATPKRVRSPLAQFPSSSYTQPSPHGCVLIMSPWNYPFMLTIAPLANAIAAGNTILLKPSAYSPATSAIIEKIIRKCFPAEYIAVVTGGHNENAHLLEMKFDFIFFTGSQAVGKEVLRHAAERLTPVVLELGGKSPCIVDATANLSLAARRIVFGKYLNCGQTCVAPDFILCESTIKDKLIQEIDRQIRIQFGENPLDNPEYGKIITEKHFDRLGNLMDQSKIIIGGESNRQTLQIAPTVLTNISWQSAIMQEEIFGPLMPVLTFNRFEEVVPLLSSRPKPLALYIFSENRTHISAVMKRCAFGGGCVNDTIIHLATSEMPFGGVGESGMGAYHGKAGFEAFSHIKSIVNKKTCLDLPMRYHPYRKFYKKLLRVFLR